MKLTFQSTIALTLALAFGNVESAAGDNLKPQGGTNLRGNNVAVTPAASSSSSRKLQGLEIVNIVDGFRALAVDTDDCGSIYSSTPVAFQNLQRYVPGNPTGQTGFVTTSKHEWILHKDNRIESVHCPGKVLDLFGADCDRGEIILYGQNDQNNQKWYQIEAFAFLYKYEDQNKMAFSSGHCPDHFISTYGPYPVSLSRQVDYEFKETAFTLQPVAVPTNAPTNSPTASPTPAPTDAARAVSIRNILSGLSMRVDPGCAAGSTVVFEINTTSGDQRLRHLLLHANGQIESVFCPGLFIQANFAYGDCGPGGTMVLAEGNIQEDKQIWNFVDTPEGTEYFNGLVTIRNRVCDAYGLTRQRNGSHPGNQPIRFEDITIPRSNGGVPIDARWEVRSV